MSVINQVLIDLERRRASGAERGVLPHHVRALPQSAQEPKWGWIAAGSLAAAATLFAAWTVLSSIDLSGIVAPVRATPPRGAEVAIEKVVSASAGIPFPPARNEGAGKEDSSLQAFRLSLELSNPPSVSEPVPTARVVEKTEAVARRTDEPRAAAAPRREAAGPVAAVASARPAPAAPTARPEIKKEVREPTPRELAENEYRKATALLHQRRGAEAMEGFQAALAQYPAHHAARQALVGLLLEGKQYAEAERVLQGGLGISLTQIGFAMTLARLQVNRDDSPAAIGTLQSGLQYAKGSADYQAFLGALLQRQGAHAEAIEQFQAALRIRPQSGVWWLGLGISLQAIGRASDAQEAYRRARESTGLNPDLAAFAEQRLRQLQ